ncbi:MAG: cbb3-type cytochrome c oxidase N-terminal domain-containing protein, partial [Thermoproteota archaeon]
MIRIGMVGGASAWHARSFSEMLNGYDRELAKKHGFPMYEARVEGARVTHVWDEDLQELNNPLPRWWLNMFYITLVFGVVYLVLYPGLGTFAGVFGWTQIGQYQKEVESVEKRIAPLYEQYLREDLKALAANPEALKTGERLYINYCT